MTIMTQDSTHADNAAAREESPAAAETLGCYLKRHRLQQKLELEDIARKIRVQTTALQAIEEDNHAALPAEVFTRGFIKSYARHLGLDPEEALDWHIRQTAEKGRPREEKINVQEVLASEELAHPPNFRWGRGLFFIFLIFALVALGYLALTAIDLSAPDRDESMREGTVEAPARTPEPVLPAIEPEIPEEEIIPESGEETGDGALLQGEMGNAPGQVLGSAAGPSLAQPVPAGENSRTAGGHLLIVPEKTKTPPLAASAAAAASSPVPAPGPAGGYVLSADFSDTTWIRVQIDDKKAQSFTYQRGDKAAWQADKKISIFVGNAGGVALALNNKRLPPIGKPGQSVRATFP